MLAGLEAPKIENGEGKSAIPIHFLALHNFFFSERNRLYQPYPLIARIPPVNRSQAVLTSGFIVKNAVEKMTAVRPKLIAMSTLLFRSLFFSFSSMVSSLSRTCFSNLVIKHTSSIDAAYLNSNTIEGNQKPFALLITSQFISQPFQS